MGAVHSILRLILSLSPFTTMAETAEVPPIHPVAPRLKSGHKKPHVGPHIDDYRAAHKETVGHESDGWWARVCVSRQALEEPLLMVWVTASPCDASLGSPIQDRQGWQLRDWRHRLVPRGWFKRVLQLCRSLGFQTPQQGTRINLTSEQRLSNLINPVIKTAIIYEGDEPDEGREITYAELLREVSSVANVLKEFGVKKGDTVSIYLPMTWQAVAAFLACARIGAVHSVVFAGFSAESLRDRAQDCKCRVLITSDEGKRGGKTIATKAIVDAALKECPLVEHVLVLKRTGNNIPWTEGRDKWWHEETLKVPNYCPPEVMASEDPLFILYVSPMSERV